MAKVILVCGRICSGKTTYAKRIRGAVLLSVDEVMLALFGQHAGEKHDEYAKRTQALLRSKSLEFVEAGVDVVLDWGFWTQDSRKSMKRFYRERNVACEFHYIDPDEGVWKARLEERNSRILEGGNDAYYVDENLARKFESIFEAPEESEVDVWIRN